MALIGTNERGQTDAALVWRFRQATAKRGRAAVFDRVVRAHRDAVLGRCTERLWPDADGAVAAADRVFIVAYLAMGDPDRLARPGRLRDWLLGIASDRALASGLPDGIDAIDWGALQAGIGADVPDLRDSATRRASMRRWLEQILVTLPQPRQEMYDLFVRRALDSRKAAMELGTDVAEARRLRRENREAILRAFEITAFAVAEAALGSPEHQVHACGELRQILDDGQRGRGGPEGVRRDIAVLPADLRLTVTRHLSDCVTCNDRSAGRMAQWAPEVLPVLAGAELNEQVIGDLRTIPEPAGAYDKLAVRPRGAHRDTRLAGTGKTVVPRRAIAATAAAGVLVVLLLLGFVQPGFLLSAAGSVPPRSSSSPNAPGGSARPRMSATPGAVSGRAVPTAANSSVKHMAPIAGVTSAGPTAAIAAPAPPPAPGTPQPSSLPTSPSAEPATTPPTTSSPSTQTPSPSPSASRPSPVPSTPAPSSPAPTTPPPTTPAPTPTPTQTPTLTPTPTPSESATNPAPSTPTPSSPAPSGSPTS